MIINVYIYIYYICNAVVKRKTYFYLALTAIYITSYEMPYLMRGVIISGTGEAKSLKINELDKIFFLF